MYIINTTLVIDPAVHERWYSFFVGKFIPLLRTQQFDILAFTRVLTEQSDGNYTYSLQVEAHEITDYNRFINESLDEYITTARALFGDGALHFTTLLKKIPLN